MYHCEWTGRLVGWQTLSTCRKWRYKDSPSATKSGSANKQGALYRLQNDLLFPTQMFTCNIVSHFCIEWNYFSKPLRKKHHHCLPLCTKVYTLDKDIQGRGAVKRKQYHLRTIHIDRNSWSIPFWEFSWLRWVWKLLRSSGYFFAVGTQPRELIKMAGKRNQVSFNRH